MPVVDLEALRLEALAHRLVLEEAPGGELAAVLARLLLRRAPYLDQRKADELAGAALAGAPHPFDALDQLSRRFLRWSDGEPMLVVDPPTRHVRYLLDEDLLVAARVAWHVPAGRAAEPLAPPDPWQLAGEPLQPALDQDLADILEGPIAETHLHLWGAAPPLVDWLPLMLDLVSLAHKGAILAVASLDEGEEIAPRPELAQSWIARLAEAGLLRLRLAAAVRDLSHGEHPFRHVERLPSPAELEAPSENRQGRSDERRTASRVQQLRAALTALGYRRPSDPEAAAIPGCPVWVDPGGTCPFRDPLSQAVLLEMGASPPKESLALGERVLLASALRIAKPPIPRRAPEVRQALPALLLRYLRIKSAYVRLLFHRGPVRGLDRFRSSHGRRAVVWRGASHRARQVWSLAIESYWTQLATLRWIQASTSLPLLSSRQPSSRQRPGADPRQSFIRARVPDLERKLELRVTPKLASGFGRTLHAQARGLRDALTVLAGQNRATPTAAAGISAADCRVSNQKALPRFRAGLIFHLRKDLRTRPESHTYGVRQIFAWLRDHPAYLMLVVGLDAASSELDQPPADFAPAFRLALDEMAEPASRNRPALTLGMTFHVGEDSRDLLTGIRQVDLAVRLLGLRNSDRLGHALALGFEPRLWYGLRNDIVALPIGDHLLNLLWARHHALRGTPLDGRLLGRLDAQLAELSIRDLDGAQATVDEWLDGQRGLERESDLQRRLVAHLPGAALAGHPHEKDVTAEWLELVSALQDTVARSVATQGLYIEANPSSNLVISGLTRFENLPLFRQHPLPGPRSVKRPPLRTSISTDDPGLFQTGLREEYALLLAAALAVALKSKQHTRQEILDWLDDLRAIGYGSSFLRGQPPPGEQFLDYLRSITR